MKKIMVLVLFLILASLPGWCQPIIPQCEVGNASGSILSALGGALLGGNPAQLFKTATPTLPVHAINFGSAPLISSRYYSGVSAGNSAAQANCVVPTGTLWALVMTAGDYYNGVAGSHTGSMVALVDVANGGKCFVVLSTAHSAGSGQIFTLFWSAGSSEIVVTNGSSMSYNQSGRSMILCFKAWN